MRVLLAHVRYRTRGGEDQVFEDEVRLLRAAGVEVSTLDVPSLDLRELGVAAAARIAMSRGDHEHGRRLVRQAIAENRPDVVHFHNIYPLLGVGAMREARARGCGVVRTYHNYRLSCIAGTHFYGGCVCELCAPGRRRPGIMRACYRSSKLQSAAMAAACEVEWDALVHERLPDMAICPAEFGRDRLLALGVAAERLAVKRNSVDAGSGETHDRSGAIFVGRLSAEKGVTKLVESWGDHLPRLTVVGDGPLMSLLAARQRANVVLAGAKPREEVRGLVSRASVLVMPSLAYEGALPLAVVEAFAEGTPVVCFDHGTLSEVGRSLSATCVASSGDFGALVRCAAGVLALDHDAWGVLSARANAVYEHGYTHDRAVQTLLGIYSAAVDADGASAGADPGSTGL